MSRRMIRASRGSRMLVVDKYHKKCGSRLYKTRLNGRLFCRKCWEYVN